MPVDRFQTGAKVMVENTKTTQATEDLQEALEAALASGLTQGDIVSMVAGAMKHAEEAGCQAALPNFPQYGQKKAFRELPPGLITLPEAARKFRINRYTLRSWVNDGKIATYGRLRGRAPGGGFLLLNESEVIAYKDGPRLRSR